MITFFLVFVNGFSWFFWKKLVLWPKGSDPFGHYFLFKLIYLIFFILSIKYIFTFLPKKVWPFWSIYLNKMLCMFYMQNKHHIYLLLHMVRALIILVLRSL